MGKVIGDVSMSIDGCIAGPNARPGNPLGDGGDRLHRWMLSPTRADNELLDKWDIPAGAVIVGRRMFDEGEEPWGENPPWHLPVVIVTHDRRPTVTKEGGTSYYFETGGITAALDQALDIAQGKDVMIGGGAHTLEQFLAAGLLDEIRLHVVPVVMGGGRRVFASIDGGPYELEAMEVVESPGATHLRYRVIR